MTIKKSKKTEFVFNKVKNIAFLVLEGFSENQIAVGASTLTYYTLLSLIPILAFFIGFAKGFLEERIFINFLIRSFPDQGGAIESLVVVAKRSLEEAHNGVIVGVGALLYLWAGVQLLTQLEHIVNEMWEVSTSRPFLTKIGDYISLFFLAPIFLAMSISLTAYFSGGLDVVDRALEGLPVVLTFFYLLISTIPPLITWMLATFIFIYIPNTPVKLIPACIAGAITSLFFGLLQWAYIFSQSWLSSYNTVYGTLVALPLLLIWVNLSWTLILLGSKIAYAIQHANFYGFHKDNERISQRLYCALGIQIMQLCVDRWIHEKPPISDDSISALLEIPQGVTNLLLDDMLSAHLITEVTDLSKRERHFQPALNVEELRVAKVLEALRSHGKILPFLESHKSKTVREILKEFDNLAATSEYNVLIKDL
jgi:membrane protein